MVCSSEVDKETAWCRWPTVPPTLPRHPHRLPCPLYRTLYSSTYRSMCRSMYRRQLHLPPFPPESPRLQATSMLTPFLDRYPPSQPSPLTWCDATHCRGFTPAAQLRACLLLAYVYHCSSSSPCKEPRLCRLAFQACSYCILHAPVLLCSP